MYNNRNFLKNRTKQFLQAFEAALLEARALVFQRDSTGRNFLISPYEMFPNGPQDILFLLHMKVGRAVGHQRAGRWDKADEEVVDILNYAAFYKVLRTEWEEQEQASRSDALQGLDHPQMGQNGATQVGTPVRPADEVVDTGSRPTAIIPTRRTGPDPEDREPIEAGKKDSKKK